MTKAELIRATAKRAGVTYEAAEAIFISMLSVATEALEAGKPIRLNGFGTLEARERKGRTVRNMVTGEPLTIPTRKTVAFTAADALRDKINGAQRNTFTTRFARGLD